MMATRNDLGLQPKTRMTTYGKAFKKRPFPGAGFTTDQDKKDGLVSPSAPAPSIWDFQDDDEISTPYVTTPQPKPMKKLKQYGRKSEMKSVRTSAPLPRRQIEKAVETEVVAPAAKKRRISPEKKDSRGPAERAYSTPASSPSSSPSLGPLPVLSPKPVVRPPKSRTLPKATYSSSSKAKSVKDSTLKETRKENVADSMPFTPGTVKTLKGLSLNKPTQKLFQSQIPFRPTQEIPGGVVLPSRPVKAPTPNPTPATQSKPSTKKRQRLIDTLAEQAEESSSSSSSSEEEEDEAVGMSQNARRSPEAKDVSIFDLSSPSSSTPERPKMYARQESMKKTGGPKFTYGSQRSILAEDTFGDMGDGGDDLLLSQSLLPPSTSQFDMDDEDDEPFTTGAVKSIHELRQAGANSRFADQMHDLLERVGRASGKTASSRRNALLELALKLQDKSFSRQFRDHTGDGRLFAQLGKETDLVAGYALVAILSTLLATTTSAHIIRQLQGQGFSLLLGRLLASSTDITSLAKDRKSNLSRHGQESVTKLKAALLKLSVWDPVAPSTLSPRSLALKALDLVDKQSSSTAAGDEFFSHDVTDRLFSILSNASDLRSWDLPGEDDSVDFYLAVSLLESHSIQAMQTESKEQWTTKHLPIIADTLGATLRHNTGHLSQLGVLVLKLTLNAANNNHDASAAFVEKGTLRDLAEALCDTFNTAKNSVAAEEVFSSIIQSLLLMLGVMINFSEHDPSAGSTLSSTSDASVSPLDRFIKLFLDHSVATSEVRATDGDCLNHDTNAVSRPTR